MKTKNYNTWRYQYNDYLRYIYEMILVRYYNMKELPFEAFCKFMFSKSSGFIS